MCGTGTENWPLEREKYMKNEDACKDVTLLFRRISWSKIPKLTWWFWAAKNELFNTQNSKLVHQNIGLGLILWTQSIIEEAN